MKRFLRKTVLIVGDIRLEFFAHVLSSSTSPNGSSNDFAIDRGRVLQGLIDDAESLSEGQQLLFLFW